MQTPGRGVYQGHRRPGWQVRSLKSRTQQAVCVIFITADCLLSSHRTVKCTKHNWKLNVSTMKYVNPPDSFLQDELGKFCHHLYFGFKIATSGLRSCLYVRPGYRVCLFMTTTWHLPLSTLCYSDCLLGSLVLAGLLNI